VFSVSAAAALHCAMNNMFVMHGMFCEPKETISGRFLNIISGNLILIAVH
jgi:hypothetical protein